MRVVEQFRDWHQGRIDKAYDCREVLEYMNLCLRGKNRDLDVNTIFMTFQDGEWRSISLVEEFEVGAITSHVAAFVVRSIRMLVDLLEPARAAFRE